MTDSKRSGSPAHLDWLEAVGSALQENSSRFEPFIPKRPLGTSEALQRMTELEALATASFALPVPEANREASPQTAASQASPSPTLQAPAAPSSSTREPERPAAPLVVETRRPRYAPALQDPELVRKLLQKAPQVAGSRAASAAQKAAEQRSTPPATPPGKNTPPRILGEPLPKDPKATRPRPEDFRPAEVPILQRARTKPPQSR